MEKEIVKSNIKNHEQGVITWTVDTDQWLSVSIGERGWGNGYIAIPVEHPFMSHIQEQIKPLWNPKLWPEKAKDSRKINVTYDQLNDKFPIDGQEWTYSQPEEIDDKNYYVFGFDTLHCWNDMNNSSEQQVIDWIEGYVSVVNGEFPELIDPMAEIGAIPIG